MSEDAKIVERIDELVEEEHRLEREHGESQLSPQDQDRLRKIEVELDRCWDLLRQRRARRDAGLDPDGAKVRDANVVEHYQQ